MSLTLRIFLVVSAITVFVMVLRKIKKSEIQVSDSIFWFFFVSVFVVLALFPQIAYWCAGVLGFEAPVNFIFLFVIAILVLREFAMTIKLARIRTKLYTLIQEVALSEQDKNIKY